MKCPPELYQECAKYTQNNDISVAGMISMGIVCLIACGWALWVAHQVDKAERS